MDRVDARPGATAANGRGEVMKDEQRDSPLMSLPEIADLHGCSERHARDVLVRLPGFPDEAPTSTPRHRRWVRAEVVAHVTRRPVRTIPAREGSTPAA